MRSKFVRVEVPRSGCVGAAWVGYRVMIIVDDLILRSRSAARYRPFGLIFRLLVCLNLPNSYSISLRRLRGEEHLLLTEHSNAMLTSFHSVHAECIRLLR